MSHLYHNRPDGKRLQEHLDLTRSGSGKIYTLGLGNMTQNGYANFSENKYRRNRPVNNSQSHGPEIE